MRKEEFFDKLEYLLQDISDQDREDALDLSLIHIYNGPLLSEKGR